MIAKSNLPKGAGGCGPRVLIRIVAGAAGVLLGAARLPAAALSAQNVAPALGRMEAVAAAAGVFLLVAGIGAMIYGWVAHSGLVGLQREMFGALTEIDGLLKKRFEILPNLASMCYAAMEDASKVLLDLSRCRNEWTIAQTSKDKWKVGGDAQLVLKRLFAVSENYPSLRADDRFVRLQETLNGIGEQIADRRQRYNTAANVFNTRIRQFPDSWVANFAGFTSLPLLAAPMDERKPAPENFKRSPKS